MQEPNEVAAYEEDEDEVCVICKKGFLKKENVTLTQKGCDSINKASKQRKEDIHTVPGDLVHAVCRQRFTNKHHVKKAISKLNQSPSPRKHRLSGLNIASGTSGLGAKCLFCDNGSKPKKM